MSRLVLSAQYACNAQGCILQKRSDRALDWRQRVVRVLIVPLSGRCQNVFKIFLLRRICVHANQSRYCAASSIYQDEEPPCGREQGVVKFCSLLLGHHEPMDEQLPVYPQLFGHHV